MPVMAGGGQEIARQEVLAILAQWAVVLGLQAEYTPIRARSVLSPSLPA